MSPQPASSCPLHPRFSLRRRGRNDRSGVVVVLVALLMVVLFACLSFVVDLGHLRVVQSELQNAADGACLAAIKKFPTANTASALAAARQYANLNHSYSGSPSSVLVASTDVEPGTWDTTTRTFTGTSASNATAVRVTTRRSASGGNPVTLFFANVLGQS